MSLIAKLILKQSEVLAFICVTVFVIFPLISPHVVLVGVETNSTVEILIFIGMLIFVCTYIIF